NKSILIQSGEVQNPKEGTDETSILLPDQNPQEGTNDIAYVNNPAVLGTSDSQNSQQEGSTSTKKETTSALNAVSGQAKELITDLQNKGFDDEALKDLLPAISGPQKVTSLEINVLDSVAIKQAVVTESFLNTIGFNSDNLKDALGTEFSLQMTLIGDLIPSLSDKKIQSKKTTYSIVGIIPGNSPFIYVPLADIKSLGVTNYTQAKVVAESDTAVPYIRQRIEGLGFQTQSVQDTLSRIESLFNGLRIALLFLGILALSVASLGMFNTLTVSLLERTHEVGLLKAMGMKSGEVKELFLAESLILGFFGGVAGLLFGFLVGKLIDLSLSAFSISAGIGYLSVTYIPLALVGFVLVLSFLIGVLTGLYPSKRATRISALDALRYE
ncbi:MAG TPA: ABC transporter permease, partial [candidate division WWE3 bacterium]|nr:ABC transporter permease [candidate division WWE3 bacterium]